MRWGERRTLLRDANEFLSVHSTFTVRFVLKISTRDMHKDTMLFSVYELHDKGAGKVLLLLWA